MYVGWTYVAQNSEWRVLWTRRWTSQFQKMWRTSSLFN